MARSRHRRPWACERSVGAGLSSINGADRAPALNIDCACLTRRAQAAPEWPESWPFTDRGLCWMPSPRCATLAPTAHCSTPGTSNNGQRDVCACPLEDWSLQTHVFLGLVFPAAARGSASALSVCFPAAYWDTASFGLGSTVPVRARQQRTLRDRSLPVRRQGLQHLDRHHRVGDVAGAWTTAMSHGP